MKPNKWQKTTSLFLSVNRTRIGRLHQRVIGCVIIPYGIRWSDQLVVDVHIQPLRIGVEN